MKRSRDNRVKKEGKFYSDFGALNSALDQRILTGEKSSSVS